MNKKQLRKLYLENRDSLTLDECQLMSKYIAQNFFNFPEFNLSQPLSLHVYLPIKDKKEVDTFLIVEKLLNRFPHVRIALSKSDFTDYSMQFFEYTQHTRLIENFFGIPEPQEGNSIQPEQLDMVLLPLVLTDELGNRIGYGKGFYDRFLAHCRPDCKKIGLSFEKPVSKIIPDEFDIPLDFCITPEKVYDFRKSGSDL